MEATCSDSLTEPSGCGGSNGDTANPLQWCLYLHAEILSKIAKHNDELKDSPGTISAKEWVVVYDVIASDSERSIIVEEEPNAANFFNTAFQGQQRVDKTSFCSSLLHLWFMKFHHQKTATSDEPGAPPSKANHEDACIVMACDDATEDFTKFAKKANIVIEGLETQLEHQEKAKEKKYNSGGKLVRAAHTMGSYMRQVQLSKVKDPDHKAHY